MAKRMQNWDELLNKTVELSMIGGQSCSGIVKKYDEKSVTIQKEPEAKVLVFELSKIQKVRLLDE